MSGQDLICDSFFYNESTAEVNPESCILGTVATRVETCFLMNLLAHLTSFCQRSGNALYGWPCYPSPQGQSNPKSAVTIWLVSPPTKTRSITPRRKIWLPWKCQ